MRRPRGPGGRFLTATEIAAMEELEKAGLDPNQAINSQPEHQTQQPQQHRQRDSQKVEHARQQLKQEELLQQQHQHSSLQHP